MNHDVICSALAGAVVGSVVMRIILLIFYDPIMEFMNRWLGPLFDWLGL